MRTNKIYLTLIFLLCFVLNIFAQPSASYYSNIDGLKKESLKSALGTILKNHTKRTYDDLKTDYKSVYVVAGTSNQVYDIFSNEVYNYTASSWNREHVVPNSWWGKTRIAAYSDLISVIPADATANSHKSNYPLGVVGSDVSYDNGAMKIGKPVSGQGGGHTYVFEPCDKYKGDFARIYLYVATCYDDITWSSSVAKTTFTNETYPTLASWLVDLLLQWNKQDPVSDEEKAINNAVEKIQNNRNPFIDYPVLADYIWGTRTDSTFNLSKAILYEYTTGTTPTTPTDTVVTPKDTTVVTPIDDPTTYKYDWKLVSNVSELTAGTQLVMACFKKQAVATDLGSNTYLGTTSATFSDDSCYITTLPSDALVLTLGGASGAWTLSNSDGQTLGATSAKKLSWGSGTATWAISVANNTATIKSTNSSYGSFQYNSSAPRFLNYTSNQTPIQLYRKVQTFLKGDINQDGTVNVGDLTQLVSLIMDNYADTTTLTFKIADLNEDQTINVGDLTDLVTLIMAGE